MILENFAKALKNRDWFTVLIEVFAVVFGVFIGLQVDDWNQARKDRAAEQVYLQELRDDFEADRVVLSEIIERTGGMLQAMVGLVEQSQMETPTWSVEELNLAMGEFQRMPNFFPTDRTYSNLTGSGDLKIITSRELKNALADHFRRAKTTELVQNTHEMELVQTFQPYIIENLDYLTIHYGVRTNAYPLPTSLDQDQILEVLKTQGFRNVIVQKWVILDDLLAQFQLNLERTENIIETLEAELVKN